MDLAQISAIGIYSHVESTTSDQSEKPFVTREIGSVNREMHGQSFAKIKKNKNRAKKKWKFKEPLKDIILILIVSLFCLLCSHSQTITLCSLLSRMIFLH